MTTKHCILNADNTQLKLSIFDAVQLIHAEHWLQITKGKQTYLSLQYLKALETTLPEIAFRYIIFYDDQFSPVGVAAIQLHRFQAEEINYSSFSPRLSEVVPRKVLELMDARVMLCGNAFSTGQNGFLFCESLPEEIGINNLITAMHRIKNEEKKSDDQISLIVIKDFWPESFHTFKWFAKDKFREVSPDVNMVLTIREEWVNMEAYMADMNTKFRTKIKGIYKKSKAIEVRNLTADQILESGEQIDRLYLEVLNRAKFNFGTLKATTFATFKVQFPNQFNLKAYFLEQELVGFSTSFCDGIELDANFVGVRYDLNVEYALYQRMLCDFVGLACQMKCKTLQLGRTAEEIKSGFGAEPVEMKILLKHRNHITNSLIKPIAATIKPSSFELRKPFKASAYQRWIR